MPAEPLTAAALAEDVRRLSGMAAPDRVALAVSGGGDSLALMRLSAQAFPHAHVLTMDHGLRAEAAAEASVVVARAQRLGLAATVLRPETPLASANVQAEARRARYAAMARWCRSHDVPLLLTAHHADDQAETLLMRLARGSGLSGLSGIRPRRDLGGVLLLRPLLGWPRADLLAVLDGSGWTPVQDPANRDPRFDRTHARTLLAATGWLEPDRLAASARHLAEADAALGWAAARAFASRSETAADALLLDPDGLPGDIRRRLLLLGFAQLQPDRDLPDGPSVAAILSALAAGRPATAAGVLVQPMADGRWRLGLVPPHAIRAEVPQSRP